VRKRCSIFARGRGDRTGDGAKLDVCFAAAVPQCRTTRSSRVWFRAWPRSCWCEQCNIHATSKYGQRDFAYYLECVPGMMFRLAPRAATRRDPACTRQRSTSTSVPRGGAKIFARTVVQWSEPTTVVGSLWTVANGRNDALNNGQLTTDN